MATFKDDGSGVGVQGVSDRQIGVHGINQRPSGIHSPVGAGVLGESADGTGVFGASANHYGVHGIQQAATGIAAPTGAGVAGEAKDGAGVYGTSSSRFGVHGVQQAPSGIEPPSGAGVAGESRDGDGVYGASANRFGVEGTSKNSAGVWAYSDAGEGLHAESRAEKVAAVAAFTRNPNGTGAAIYAEAGGKGPAALFKGRAIVTETLVAQGNVEVSGDVLLAGGDLAEDFELLEAGTVGPGTVVVLDDSGRVQVSDRPYDRRVAGVLAGAGSTRPGIVLNRVGRLAAGRPVALVGRTYCRVEAGTAAIETGDLLTTSSIRGCAMKATDPGRSFGAVLGKAMAPLRDGVRLLPVLVTLT